MTLVNSQAGAWRAPALPADNRGIVVANLSAEAPDNVDATPLKMSDAMSACRDDHSCPGGTVTRGGSIGTVVGRSCASSETATRSCITRRRSPPLAGIETRSADPACSGAVSIAAPHDAGQPRDARASSVQHRSADINPETPRRGSRAPQGNPRRRRLHPRSASPSRTHHHPVTSTSAVRSSSRGRRPYTGTGSRATWDHAHDVRPAATTQCSMYSETKVSAASRSARATVHSRSIPCPQGRHGRLRRQHRHRPPVSRQPRAVVLLVQGQQVAEPIVNRTGFTGDCFV